jgi:hypothetical protein
MSVCLQAPVHISSPKRLCGCRWSMARDLEEFIATDVLIAFRPCPDWYGRSPLSCLFMAAAFFFMSLAPIAHYWTTMKHKTKETKNPILPACSDVTLKHNITSPEVRCLSVCPSIHTISRLRQMALVSDKQERNNL